MLKFRIRFPIAKRLFDFWFKLFEDISKASLIALLPYLKFMEAPFEHKLGNIAFCILVAASAYVIMHWLADNEAWISRKDEE